MALVPRALILLERPIRFDGGALTLAERAAMVLVRFFGRLADVGGASLELPLDAPCSLADLRARLLPDHPQLGGSTVRAFVDDTLVDDRFPIDPRATVDFLPTVSGG